MGLRKLYNLLKNGNRRYSKLSIALRSLLELSESEKMIKIAVEFVKSSRLEGDYLEFGVDRGKGIIDAYHNLKIHSMKNRLLYAFDSFGGLPEIKGIDGNGYQHFKKGEHSCSEDDFKKYIKKEGVPLNRVKIIKGWFDKSLNNKTIKKYNIRKASIINIDCDLYESTVPVLKFITNLIQSGTIIIFDDWYCFRGDENRGEQKAVKEWLKENKQIKLIEYRKFGWHGNSFIVNIDESKSKKNKLIILKENY